MEIGFDIPPHMTPTFLRICLKSQLYFISIYLDVFIESSLDCHIL